MLPPYLTDEALTDLIERALAEDVGAGDVTTLATVPEETTARGRFLAKAEGVLAGCLVADRVFNALDEQLAVSWSHSDGEQVAPGVLLGTVKGPARSMLTAERLVLNLMQRMSGIATATWRMQAAARPHGARILDTRKTAPGLRRLDKWAVRIGGGANHRLGLFDQILIKDNHIVAAGGLRPALRAAKEFQHRHEQDLPIEVETTTLEEVRAALEEGGVDVILLDNMAGYRDDGAFSTDQLQEAVTFVDGRVQTEASGNVTLDTVPDIAATGVDFISSGALTHSVQALDISLNIELMDSNQPLPEKKS